MRSNELASHPLVVEFLKIDHSAIDNKIGMKEFSKKLTKEEDLLKKLNSNKEKVNNRVFRVTSTKERI